MLKFHVKQTERREEFGRWDAVVVQPRSVLDKSVQAQENSPYGTRLQCSRVFFMVTR